MHGIEPKHNSDFVQSFTECKMRFFTLRRPMNVLSCARGM